MTIVSTPASVVTGSTLAPAITVHVDDANGNVVTTDNSNVTLSLPAGSAGTSSGTTNVAAQAGVATFSDVVISGVGISTLIASDGMLTTATSEAINVTPQPSQLVPAFAGVSIPVSVVTGSKIKGKATVIVRNTGAAIKGSVTVKLFADIATILDGKQFLGATSVKRVTLKTGKTQAFALNLTSLPPTLGAGVYHLLAEVIDASGATNVITARQTIQVAAAFVSPVISVGSVTPGSLAVGKAGSLLVTVTNEGNVSASGINITLSPSSTGAAPIAGYMLDTMASGVSIAPTKSKSFKLRFKIKSTFAAGTYLPYVSFQLSGVKTTMAGAVPFVIG